MKLPKISPMTLPKIPHLLVRPMASPISLGPTPATASAPPANTLSLVLNPAILSNAFSSGPKMTMPSFLNSAVSTAASIPNLTRKAIVSFWTK